MSKDYIVDPRGLEPLTFSMSMKRSSQLSYGSMENIVIIPSFPPLDHLHTVLYTKNTYV